MATISSQLRAISKASFQSENERKAAVAETRALLNRLETPWETAYRYTWIHPSRMACLRVASQLDLFKKWKAAGGKPMAVEELQKLVVCNSKLFARIVANLAGTGMLEVVQPGTFGLTPFTSDLAEAAIASTLDLFFETNIPINLNLPSYLASIGYTNPTDQEKSNFAHCFGTPVWEWLKTHPKADGMIGAVMAAYGANRPGVADIYPTETLLTRAEADGIFLVDIGGGVGHDSAAFVKAHTLKPGRVVLEDRPSALENATTLDRAVEKRAYDFFTPQPVKGAAAYYLHCVLHDWPDEDCVRILDNQKTAMKRGHSKLLVHEIVLDLRNPEATRTSSDITMMGMASGKERTEAEWTAVLERAGFGINRIYSLPLVSESVIEAELL